MVRIIYSNVKFCQNEKQLVSYVMVAVGLAINATCAITIFVITHYQPDQSGNINFQVPQTIFEAKYSDREYFQVSQAGSQATATDFRRLTVMCHKITSRFVILHSIGECFVFQQLHTLSSPPPLFFLS